MHQETTSEVTLRQLFASISAWWPLALMFAGLAIATRPSLLANRFGDAGPAAGLLAPGLGLAMIAGACGAIAWRFATTDRLRLRLQCLLSVAIYLPLTYAFLDWHVDDAAITYAYSENLARGFGLVLHPSHAPEEAYSNTLWMLLLAGLRTLGMDVALAAKLLGTVVGALTLALTVLTCQRLMRKPPSGFAYAVMVAANLSAPFLIWSVSGLEHGIQALLLLGYVWFASDREKQWIWPHALIGVALVLVRPEAPIIVAAVFFCLAALSWREHRSIAQVVRLWPIAVVPALTLGALLIFRWSYFGDLLPNPYYAKAAEQASFVKLLNPLSSGYVYTLRWLAQAAAFLVIVPLLMLRRTDFSRGVWVALIVLAAQIIFVIYAGGDWMSHWRFLCAPLPLFALLAAYAIDTAVKDTTFLRRYAVLTACLLWLSNVHLLVQFRDAPTTPYTIVSAIGQRFVDLAARLGFDNPSLAHHDAGGTSYRARIDLLDLGGLGTRDIAKHMNDVEYLTDLVLRQKRPDFVFGASDSFVAGKTRFHETEEFKRDYVRLDFVDLPYMNAALCHIRRERLKEVPGVSIERDGDGTIIKVRVSSEASVAMSQ